MFLLDLCSIWQIFNCFNWAAEVLQWQHVDISKPVIIIIAIKTFETVCRKSFPTNRKFVVPQNGPLRWYRQWPGCPGADVTATPLTLLALTLMVSVPQCEVIQKYSESRRCSVAPSVILCLFVLEGVVTDCHMYDCNSRKIWHTDILQFSPTSGVLNQFMQLPALRGGTSSVLEKSSVAPAMSTISSSSSSLGWLRPSKLPVQ